MAKFERTKPHVNVGTIGCVDNRKTLLTAALAKVARLESATTPAEVGEPALRLQQDVVNRFGSSRILAGDYYTADQYATLAHQLAEATDRRDRWERLWNKADARADAQEERADDLARQLAEANGTVLALTARAAGAENASKLWQSRAEQAESQLAEATRRLGEVEAIALNLVAVCERADHAEGYCCCGMRMDTHDNGMDSGHAPVDAGEHYAQQAIAEAQAALTKEPAK